MAGDLLPLFPLPALVASKNVAKELKIMTNFGIASRMDTLLCLIS